MRVWLFRVFLAVGLAFAASCTSEGSSEPGSEGAEGGIRVMSQNLYVGASVARLVDGTPPSELLETVENTDFTERAEQIAKQVKTQNPDLIGLQEAADITVTEGGEETLRLDYVEILLAALEKQGLTYEVAISGDNLEGTIPLGVSQTIQVKDRDVILYRPETTSIAEPAATNFAEKATFEVAIFQLDSLRGYTSVKATVGDQTIRFVNTHLEVQTIPCGVETAGQPCQERQAAELVDELDSSELPVVVVGDLNAETDEPTYSAFSEAGFENVWDLADVDGSGATCCFGENLDDETAELSQRIDHILVRTSADGEPSATAEVVGDSIEERTSSGLWPSDHAGVTATIKLP